MALMKPGLGMNTLPTVRDLMDLQFTTLRPDMEVAQAIGVLLKKRLTGAAVIDTDGKLLGLLSERDCLRPLVNGAYGQIPVGLVKEYMMTEVFTVEPDTDVFELASKFVQNINRRFLVLEDDRLIGQITRRDLLRAIQKYWA